MADKELRWLSRSDLIEIIYEVRRNEAALQKENEGLQRRLEELKRRLEDRQSRSEKAGSLSELAASLNGLFEAAQATADDYLADVRDLREQAEQLRQDAEKKAEALTKRTLQERSQLLTLTEAQCQRMLARAAAQVAAAGQTADGEPDAQARSSMEGRADE